MFPIVHSITLALTMFGVVSLPAKIVEPMIALSIAYVAIENLIVSELKPWRLALVFSFGLLHGMGFAGVLRDLGLPRSQFLTALVSFNVGVEGWQLLVIAVAFAAIAVVRGVRLPPSLKLRRTAVALAEAGQADLGGVAYRRFIVQPASVAIALVGVSRTRRSRRRCNASTARCRDRSRRRGMARGTSAPGGGAAAAAPCASTRARSTPSAGCREAGCRVGTGRPAPSDTNVCESQPIPTNVSLVQK